MATITTIPKTNSFPTDFNDEPDDNSLSLTENDCGDVSVDLSGDCACGSVHPNASNDIISECPDNANNAGDSASPHPDLPAASEPEAGCHDHALSAASESDIKVEALAPPDSDASPDTDPVVASRAGRPIKSTRRSEYLYSKP